MMMDGWLWIACKTGFSSQAFKCGGNVKGNVKGNGVFRAG